MALLAPCLVISMYFATINAAPVQPGQPTNRAPARLSNEAIVGLVSLFVAVLGISITLMASPKMRRNIRNCITRNRRHSMQQLRQKYAEFQQFQEYLAMTAM